MHTAPTQNKMLGLVIFILTVSNIWLAHGDEALVKQVCDGTPNPDVCERCLKNADADSNRTDLAFRSIACSLGTSGLVNSDLGVISNSSDDPVVKEKCASCQQLIWGEAGKNLQTAEILLKGGDSPGAAKQVTAAMGKLTDCSNLNLTASPPFPQDFTWLTFLYVDTQSILHQL